MEFVKVEHGEGTAVVTLSRGKSNPINDQVVEELAAAVAGAAADETVRAVVLASDRPKFFSTGFDLAEVFRYEREKMTDFFGRFIDLYELIYTLPKPVVAAVSGHAFAGGAILALACDARVMAEGEFGFALNEINFGVLVPAGAARMAMDAVGVARAREIVLSGDPVAPARALEIGLAAELAPAESVLGRALFHARALGAKPPDTFAGAKRLLRELGGHYNVGDDRKALGESMDSWFSPEAQRRKKALVDSVLKQAG